MSARVSRGRCDDDVDERLAMTSVLEAVEDLDDKLASADDLAGLLLGPEAPLAPHLISSGMRECLGGMVRALVGIGWTPTDLAEITRRRASLQHVPLLAELLATETQRHRADRVAPEWRAQLEALGPAESPELHTRPGLALGLGLGAALRELPRIAETLAPPGAAPPAAAPRSGADSRQLSRVRALLAKAESTQYDEEAEVLSAKAQELISRYALERLVHGPAPEHPGQGAVSSRRLWIDAPYVMAKATLVAEIAGANRCRSVVSEQLGFCTVIGDADDLDGVDVLTTSLLVQAHTAMMRYGRQQNGYGASRTTSFRRAFWISYAGRIGERLRAATQEAETETGRAETLLPALRRRAEQVEAAFAQMFPDVVQRGTRISNGYGWAAGRAAADLACLDARRPVTQQAG